MCLKIVYEKIVDNFLLIVAVPLTIAAAAIAMARLEPNESTDRIQSFSHPQILSILLFLAIAVIAYYMQRPRMVYLVDYACFRTTYHYRVPSATFVEHVRQDDHFSERSVCFLTRLLERSGLGEETCLPTVGQYIKPYKYCTLEAAREEAQLVVFSAIDDLFAKTSISPLTIDILVVNCSGFSPTPGFPDMIMNRYKMRSDIRNVHLSGMGCSAGLVSIDLAKNLLQAMPPGARALVVSTETLTPNYYFGNERAMLLPYCLFRMGGAAVLLSTSPEKARFRLKYVVRTHTAADDKSYQCIYQKEDDKGNKGVDLSMDLMAIAARTLKANITTIAPLVLPASEKLLFAMSFVSTKLLRTRTKLYVPNFLTAFEHICIHAGGRAVIDEIQRSLGLSDKHVESSRMTLHRFGNISSSCLWYELAYIEAKRHMQRGDRVWMIGFGSGFKCNSAVWECIVPPHSEDGPWATCIHRYPVHDP
jgi:3-ketoacyl-CoA synthase